MFVTKTFWATIDIAEDCGNHTTGDRAESTSVNTSSQSGTRHPKDHCVTNLALRTEGRAYHIQVLQHREPEEYAPCTAMCHDLIEAVNNAYLMVHIQFSDEATFHTCGFINRHSSRIWADEQSYIAMEFERNTSKVNVWLGLIQQRIYGPFFFADATIPSTLYRNMFEQFLQPKLFADNILDLVVIQQCPTALCAHCA